MSKATYFKDLLCPNCNFSQSIDIPKGVLLKDYPIPPDRLCTNCGCRLDGKEALKDEHAKPEHQETAGKKWAGGDCEFYGNICVHSDDVSCARCPKVLAKAYDLGRESVETAEPAMTPEEWKFGERVDWGARTDRKGNVIEVNLDDWVWMSTAAIADYIKLNKGKVIK